MGGKKRESSRGGERAGGRGEYDDYQQVFKKKTPRAGKRKKRSLAIKKRRELPVSLKEEEKVFGE